MTGFSEQLGHVRPGVWSVPPAEQPATRFASTIRAGDPDGCTVALLGLPDDTGVKLNNGRPGAADGPSAFRRALAGFGAVDDAASGRPLTDASGIRVFDAGDVIPSELPDPVEALHETHSRVARASRVLHESGMLVVCVGGGHDLTGAAVGGLAEARSTGTRAGTQTVNGVLAGLNLDPHLDVREAVGSGMPFRVLIEAGHLDAVRYATVGVGPFANSRAHTAYLADRGAMLIGVEDTLTAPSDVLDRAFAHSFGALGEGFVTIDLDAIDGSYAPGVSAVNPLGVTPAIAAAVARRAGATPGVRHFDVMELSPVHDEGGRTARVAALLFLSFLGGLAQRRAYGEGGQA